MKPIPQIKRSKGEMLPLMDMIFLLLVIFIFMIVQMRPNFGVSVELPDIGEKVHDTIDKKKQTVTISVRSDNKIFVNESETSLDNLIKLVLNLANGADAKNIGVILRGDKASNYGNMIEIFSKLRASRITDILFDVDKKK